MTQALQVNKKEATDRLRVMLDKSFDSFLQVWPSKEHVSRMVQGMMAAVHRTPALLDCDPRSILKGVMLAAQLQLEPSGPLGQCFLIPRWNKQTGRNEATFQMGYKGLVELAYRSGHVTQIRAKVVYEGDDFYYCQGLSPRLEHVPKNRTNNLTHVYAVIKMRNGDQDFEVMDSESLRHHQEKYAGKSKTWRENREGMAKKTVVAMVCKLAPVSADMQRAVAADETGATGQDQMLPAIGNDMEGLKLRIGMKKATETTADDDWGPDTYAGDPAEVPNEVEDGDLPGDEPAAKPQPAAQQAPTVQLVAMLELATKVFGDKNMSAFHDMLQQEHGQDDSGMLTEQQCMDVIGDLKNRLANKKEPKK